MSIKFYIPKNEPGNRASRRFRAIVPLKGMREIDGVIGDLKEAKSDDVIVMAKKTKKTEDLDRLCWHCNTKLLYGGEHDTSQEDEFYESVTYMGCPECGTHVEIYKAKKNIDSYEAKSNAIH